MGHFSTYLNESEEERLALLTEEMGEVLQIVGKIGRHGYLSTNPLSNDPTTNQILLEKEIGDLLLIIKLMIISGDIRPEVIQNWMGIKQRKINQWLHFNYVGEDTLDCRL